MQRHRTFLGLGDEPASPSTRTVTMDPKWQKIGVGLQFLSVLVAAAGFYILIGTLEANTSSVQATVENGIINQVTALDRLLLDKPKLYPYFYESREPATADSLQARVAAQLFADVLDVVSIQNSRFGAQWENPEAWDSWAVDMLTHSPVLRRFVREHQTWYGHRLLAHLRTAEGRLQS